MSSSNHNTTSLHILLFSPSPTDLFLLLSLFDTLRRDYHPDLGTPPKSLPSLNHSDGTTIKSRDPDSPYLVIHCLPSSLWNSRQYFDNILRSTLRVTTVLTPVINIHNPIVFLPLYKSTILVVLNYCLPSTYFSWSIPTKVTPVECWLTRPFMSSSSTYPFLLRSSKLVKLKLFTSIGKCLTYTPLTIEPYVYSYSLLQW